MKRRWVVGVILGISVITSACGSTSSSDQIEPNETEETEPDMAGFVMDQEENRILVVAPMDDESGLEGRAMWVSDAPEGAWIGKHVEVWVAGSIAESYPEQAAAEQIKELEMSIVEGADLEASEALSTALSEAEETKQEGSILAVELLAFDEQTDQWTVKLHKRGGAEGEWKTTIKDEK